MLNERFPSQRLRSLLIPGAAWVPFPTVLQRQRWQHVPAPARALVLNRAREALAQPCPELPATLFLQFHRNGNRSAFQTPYMARRRRLTRLVLGECIEDKGRFLDAILDTVWALCEESTWSLPAHVGVQKAGSGLPDVTEPIVDLFAGETASLLAWTLYLLEARLAGLSPALAPRIRHELTVRLLDPCRRRNDFWWMGHTRKHLNNWTPWICSNWLTVNLLIEQDAARRTRAVAKVLGCLDRFVATYPPDGGCDEGPSYWGRAGASLFECLDILHAASRGRINAFDEPLVREMVRYLQRVHIGGNWFVNFADAQARLTPPEALVYRFAQRVHDRALQHWIRQFVPASGLLHQLNDMGLARSLQALFSIRDLQGARPVAPRQAPAWLPDTQIVVVRPVPSSPHGFTLAAKAGHNAENHNHNDVGSFVVYRHACPVLIDAGVGTYTRQTFSPDRYKLWTMQSQYHNLPSFNGVMQAAGRAFAARQVACRMGTTRTVFELDLAGAYPPEAGLLAWERRMTFDQAEGITVDETYRAAKPVRQVVLNFLTPCRVHLAKGRVEFRRRKLTAELESGAATLRYDADRFKVSVETIRLTDASLIANWGDCLYRVRLRVKAPRRAGTLRYQLTV